MDTLYIVVGLIAYGLYTAHTALTVKRPKSRGEVLVEALGVRVGTLEERIEMHERLFNDRLKKLEERIAANG